MRKYWAVLCALATTGLALSGVAVAAPADLVPPQALEVQAELESSSESSAEAKANLATQHQASRVNLVGQLEEEVGQSYASIWFDNEAGEFVVPVATAGDGAAATEVSEEAVEEEFSSAALDGEYRTEVVKYSSEELEAAQKLLDEDLAPLFEEGMAQTAVDPKANAVEVRISAEMAAATRVEVEALARQSAVRTKVTQVDDSAFETVPSACDENSHRCDLPVRGGEAMYGGPPWIGSKGLLEIETCTVGFRANGYDGRKYILTAGHCVHQESDAHKEVLWSWEAADTAGYWHYIGRTDKYNYPGRDWAAIDATGTWADTPPWPTQLVYWGSTDAYPVVGEASSYVGQTLCHVGEASGTSCGIVTAEHLNGEIYGPGEMVNNLFEVEGLGLSVIEGDSGGPIIANNIALGVSSGCHCKWSNAIMYFNDITEATAEMNLNIAGVGITEAITGTPLSVGTNGVTVSGQVDPHGMQTEYAFEWGQGSFNRLTTYRGVGEGQGFVPVSQEITGLEPATDYRYRITANNGFGTATGAEGNFRTAAVAPIVSTLGSEAVKKETATLVGSVNPVGEPTTYQFEYGPTTAYGWTRPVAPEGVGAGRSAVTVRQAISGLKAGTTYHFRIRAANAGGTSYGSDLTFKTPDKPAITAEGAGYVNTLEPTMNATINAERAETKYQFEYGTTEAYGTKVPIHGEQIGTSAAFKAMQPLKGLQRSTTYHYRVSAENEVGVSYGADRSFTTLPPCKGPEQKCVWSPQEPSNPLPSSRFEMKSVACISATLCVAVGKNLENNRSFVDRWNGSAWSLLDGSVAGEMKHLSCYANSCFAAGTSGGLAQTWFIGPYPAGSGTWIVAQTATPRPAGATETVLNGVSCSGESECTAVGSYKGSEGAYHPLVERWNGSAWALQSAPNPAEGTAQNAMLSVSCVEFGCVTVGEAAGKPTAETWVNGVWALSSPKLPAGAKGGRLSSVSCFSFSCMAVGQSNEGVGTEKPLAETMAGLSWSLTSVPSPAGAKGYVELAGVSCGRGTVCTATGWYASAAGAAELKTLAEAFDGSSWTIQSSANASGQAWNFLTDVSCTASSACTAVGRYSSFGGQAPESLAERWNGSAWSTQKLVNPELPTETELKSVSCATNTLCVGVGKDLLAEAGFVEVWNGTGWTVAGSIAGDVKKISCASAESCFAVGTAGGSAKIWRVFRLNGAWTTLAMTTPAPGGSEAVLDGISCAPGGATCTAVGSFKGSEGTYHPLVERWNGTAWSLQSAPDPAEGNAKNAMLSVSCGGATFCVAVGEAAGKPVAEFWDGSAWSRSVAPLLPAGAIGATLTAVSCGSTEYCMAVGDSYDGIGTEKALAERWTGFRWAPMSTPTPAGIKGFVDLTDITCLSPNACFAVGYSAPEQSNGMPTSLKTVAESWNGAEWTVLTTPNLASQTFNLLSGISCTTSIDCTAVGGATSSLTKRPPVQLAMRFE